MPEQDLLLPPSLREWLPEDHLAFFVSRYVPVSVRRGSRRIGIAEILIGPKRTGEPDAVTAAEEMLAEAGYVPALMNTRPSSVRLSIRSERKTAHHTTSAPKTSDCAAGGSASSQMKINPKSQPMREHVPDE